MNSDSLGVKKQVWHCLAGGCSLWTDLALDACLGALAGVRVTVSLALAPAHLPGNPDVLALLLLHALNVADAGLPQQGPALADGQRLGGGTAGLQRCSMYRFMAT